MLNEEEIQITENNDSLPSTELDEAIDHEVSLVPLNDEEKAIVQKIIKAPTQKELQEQFDAFNMNQSKKNALRIIKLNCLLDRVEDQAIERFEKRPDQVSNKELLEYMQVVSTQIDRSQKFIDSLQDKPMIRVNQQKNEVNINIGTEVTRDGKERVIDAIQALLKQINKTADPEPTEAIIVDSSESQIPNPEENIVYNLESGDTINTSLDFNQEGEDDE